ncbi:MAG: aminopeptidase family protein P [Paracoccaceae bacterium]|nr:aminopeptidase family protein P [Paracoccaceae bacterium]
MFQAFTPPERLEPGERKRRLAALRRRFRAARLDGFLVPSTDAWQGEFTAPSDRRLEWLTGFTGSSGICVVLSETASLHVDGRYTVQAGLEVDSDLFTVIPMVTGGSRLHPLPASTGNRSPVIGYDPWLHSQMWIADLARDWPGVTLTASPNFVDAIWSDRPDPPCAPMIPWPLSLTGVPSESKRQRIAATLQSEGQRSLVITSPDSIAWLLNTRGSDVARFPVTHAFATLDDSGKVDLFVDPAKTGDVLRHHLGKGVALHPPDALDEFLDDLPQPVRVDPARAPARIVVRLEGAGKELARDHDPVAVEKACKNDTEMAGMEAAHLRDGAAVCEFLYWLDTPPNPDAPDRTEIDVVRKLEDCRRATGALRDIAFETICGSGPNGAVVHYRVTEASNRRIRDNDILLVDSGGQYADGTTDVTRTIAVGEPSGDAVLAYSLVLKGMIALSRLRWPAGLAGSEIDAVARVALWREGLDYDHGTGHGVGAYLGVHEGPPGISRRAATPLRPGMILSNEPGYYREGQFGIRIENLLAVRPAVLGADGRDMLEFRTLTLAPLDRRLIDSRRLDRDEIHWLNTYHATVLESLTPLCSPATASWLQSACRPLDEPGDLAP